MVVRALEGFQAERLRKDPRLEKAIQGWKEVEATVEGEHSHHCSAVAAATRGLLLLRCVLLLRLAFDGKQTDSAYKAGLGCARNRSHTWS